MPGNNRTIGESSVFAQDQVRHPTRPDRLSAGAAVLQDVVAGAAGLLQRVGRDRQLFETAPLVDGAGEDRISNSFPKTIFLPPVLRYIRREVSPDQYYS
jgi:hypothetical protein